MKRYLVFEFPDYHCAGELASKLYRGSYETMEEIKALYMHKIFYEVFDTKQGDWHKPA